MMKLIKIIPLLAVCPSHQVLGFCTIRSTTQKTDLSMIGGSNFLEKIPKLSFPFPGGEQAEQLFQDSGSFDLENFELTPEALIARTKAIIVNDLGVQEPVFLDDEFSWIGPTLEKPLGKVDYVAAGRFFNIRGAFPDLNYRAHDFRIDANDPLTVRCTIRPVGTMRGQLRLRNDVVDPNGVQWRGPPEAISVTYNPQTGKVVKLCSGFVLDRFVGNTNGLCGVMAAATVAGVPPSDWEVYPLPTVISKFFGRPVDPLQEVSTFLAPFPETVMIQLAKGVLATNLAADDPTLLSKDFSFVTPSLGPIGKADFLESYAAQEFGGLEPELSNFRVDPYDPYRVWVDVKPVGPGLDGPPQAISFMFDDDGFCTRITAGAVMDPSIGNTGGLTGAEGIRYSRGEASPDLLSRPLPLALGRLKKVLLSPITKLSVDDYRLDATKGSVPKPVQDVRPPEPSGAAAAAREKQEAMMRQLETKEAEAASKASDTGSTPKPLFFMDALQPTGNDQSAQGTTMKKVTIPKEKPSVIEEQKAEAARRQEQARLEQEQIRKAKEEARRVEQERKVAELERKRSAELERKAAELERKRAAELERKRVAELAANARAEKLREAAEEQKRLQLKRQQAAEVVAKKKQLEAEKKRDASEAVRKQIEEKMKRAAEEKRVAAEAKRVAQVEAREREAKRLKVAAEQKRQEAEQRKLAQIEERKRFAEEQKAAAAKRRQEAEEKRVAAAEAAKKRADTLARQKAAASKNVKAPSKPASSMASFPRPTFSLPTLPTQSPDKPAEKAKTAPKAVSPPVARAKAAPKSAKSPAARVKMAPKGVPTVVAWVQRRDGGITGRVFGSVNFREGERIETSTIVAGNLENGNVVRTDSGSRYFLSERSVQEMREEAKERAQIPKELKNAKPRATIQLTQIAKERDAKAALEAAEQGQPRSTFSLSALFGLDQSSDEVTKPATNTPTKTAPKPVAKTAAKTPAKPTKPEIKKQAPRGVPSIARWKQNRDKSITGLISGSNAFSEGERVTTSPIARGAVAPGEVVFTSSGSRYFLQ